METHNVEWKRIWKDEYLNTICGFANGSGGVLEIGRQNNGEVVGVSNAKKLSEDLPNKIRSAMGIIPAVDIYGETDKHYIVITIQPYSFPISCNGKYYIRSGSTTQELSGVALDEFMLRTLGKTWDGVPVPYVKSDDLKSDVFKAFRKMAVGSNRMTEVDLRISDEMLLENLNLTEPNYLKRAAIMLFHQEPEKWAVGATVKIGSFETPADLSYQDEVRGPLITMADTVVDLVYLKYFKGAISYDGIHRIETYPVPRAAFREAVLNAIVHKDYSTGNPIHIHIYPDKVLIYNDGKLPENWTVENLFAPHSSKPHNPLIANAYFRSGQIEAWGRGIEKIIEACHEWGMPEPFYKVSANEVMIGFNIEARFGEKFGERFGDKFGEKETQEKILAIMRRNPKVSAKAIASEIGLTARGVEKSIHSLKSAGLVERVGAAKGGYWKITKTGFGGAER